MIAGVLSLQNFAEAGTRSLIMAGCIWLALAALRVRSVAAQKIAWTLVLAAALAMPFANSWAKSHPDAVPAPMRISSAHLVQWMHGFQAPAPRPTVLPAITPSSESPAPEFTSDTAASSDSLETVASHPSESPAQSPPRALHWMSVIALLYAAIAVLLFVRILVGLFTALRLWRSGMPWLCEEFKGVRIRISARIASPVTIGSGVLLPPSCDSWQTDKLRVVLAHESSHVRQGDFYIQLCAELHRAIFWFSPLAWWLPRKLYALNEALSDGTAARQASSHLTYAQMLLEFAAMPRTTIGVAMARPGSISARIERLLDENRFRQAFTESPVHKLITCTLIPIAVCAAVILFQVSAHATTQQESTPPAAVPTLVPPPASVPPAQQATQQVAPPADVASPKVTGDTASPSIPAMPDISSAPQAPAVPPASPETPALTGPGAPEHGSQSYGAYTHERDGEFYGLFERHGGNPHFSGTWTNGHADVLEKAQRLAHGDFLLYTDRNGKSYYIDDPEIVMSAEIQEKVLQQLYRHGDQLARAQEALKHAQAHLLERQTAPVNQAQLQKDLADLNSMLSNLHTDNVQTISPEQMRQLQQKMGELQGKLAQLQVSASLKDANLRIAEHMAQLAKEGKLGPNPEDMSRDAEQKMKSAIEQALKSSKAKPIE